MELCSFPQGHAVFAHPAEAKTGRVGEITANQTEKQEYSGECADPAILVESPNANPETQKGAFLSAASGSGRTASPKAKHG